MEFRQLSYFLEICRQGSFSKAAQSLYTSQQSLSQIIRSLEGELQTMLFVRTNAGVLLTPQGECLKEHAEKLLLEQDVFLKELHKDTSETGKLRLGSCAGFFNVLPKNFLSGFLKEHPEIPISLRSYGADQYQEALTGHMIDILLCPINFDVNIFRPVFSFRNRVSVLCGAFHPLAQKEKIYLSDIVPYRTGFLNASVVEPVTQITEQLKKSGLVPRFLLNGAEMELTLELAAQTDIAFIFAGCVEDLPEGICARKIEDLNIYWDYYFLIYKNTIVTNEMKAFVRYAQKKIKKYH